MRRLTCPKRQGWEARFKAAGFSFCDVDGYWKEGSYYEITEGEKRLLISATENLHSAMKTLVEKVVKDPGLLEYLGVPEHLHEYLRYTWKTGSDLYGRFDFVVNRGQVKALEYNADTPTSLIETASAQIEWAGETGVGKPFSEVRHELANRFHTLRHAHGGKLFHFCCMQDSEEDYDTTMWLLNLAEGQGFNVRGLYVEEIGFNEETRVFVDPNGNQISRLFKLYPWEYAIRDEFAAMLVDQKVAATVDFYNPFWRMLLSSKRMFSLLWKERPDLHWCLPRTEDSPFGTAYVKKPAFSREGANVEIVMPWDTESKPGPFGDFPSVYQEYCELPKFQNEEGQECFAIVGSWVVNDRACGFGVRESSTHITDNLSNYVPHVLVKE